MWGSGRGGPGENLREVTQEEEGGRAWRRVAGRWEEVKAGKGGGRRRGVGSQGEGAQGYREGWGEGDPQGQGRGEGPLGSQTPRRWEESRQQRGKLQGRLARERGQTTTQWAQGKRHSFCGGKNECGAWEREEGDFSSLQNRQKGLLSRLPNWSPNASRQKNKIKNKTLAINQPRAKTRGVIPGVLLRGKSPPSLPASSSSSGFAQQQPNLQKNPSREVPSSWRGERGDPAGRILPGMRSVAIPPAGSSWGL